MFTFVPLPDDDRDFTVLAARLITGAVATHRPQDVRVFQVDNWFDHKWLGFSGKTLGALGVWTKPLTVPPFVANRLVRQWHSVADQNTDVYRFLGAGPNIHHRGWSARNLQRLVRQVVPRSALFWFSGNTTNTGRGSLMGYLPVERDVWAWFLALERADGRWRITHRKNIQAYEIRSFESAAGRVERGEGRD